MRAFFVLSVMLLVACSGQPPVSEEEGTVAAGYGRVFGRVQYTYRGEPTELGMAFLGSHNVTLFLRPADSDQLHYLQPERDGTFSWPLKPGRYFLIGLSASRSAGSYREGTTRRYMAPITVPDAGSAVYIGDIRINNGAGRYTIELADDYEETVKRMQPLLASGKFRPTKALLQPEPPPGRYKNVRPICNGAWGLSCPDGNQGVEVVGPVGPGMTYPTTETLTPLLEWKPSERKDVTYDVAVYEAIQFENALSGERVAQMLGPRVVYAEGVREPKFIPATPLAPGKKYAWSVRLRDGDTVSTWSTTSFSLNLIIAATSRTGRLFGFETPAQ